VFSRNDFRVGAQHPTRRTGFPQRLLPPLTPPNPPRNAPPTMRVAPLPLCLASLLAPACSAAPNTGNVAIGEPTTVLLAPGETNPAPQTAETPAPSSSPRIALEWSLLGDTPTVAWSPDSSRLAIADQINYLNTPADPKTVGIDVLDVASGERKRVVHGPGYHPVWITLDSIAYGCSPYECDKTQGLYLLRLDGSVAQRVLDRGVYHTRASKNGSVLFFSGFPEDEGWMIMDSVRFSTRPLGDTKDSWSPPAQALDDQCPPKTSGKRVEARDDKIVLHDDAGRTSEVASAPAFRLAWPADGRVVKPCLSPDGRFVVYFSQRRGQGSMIGVRSLE